MSAVNGKVDSSFGDWRTLGVAVLLATLALLVYANGFDHAFQLDDFHSLRDNPGIRELANIPRFFTDPSYLTVLRANIDYRPVLVTTFALNYAAGGYDPWGWHLVQVLLHASCAFFLYLLGLRVVDAAGFARRERTMARSLVLLAAVLFTVHPVAAGVVNYFSARSSLLTAALLLPSFVAYMTPDTSGRWRWLAAVALYAAALFTKVEAVAALAVYLFWEVWRTAAARGHAHGIVSDLWATASAWSTWRRLWPIAVVTLSYFVVRATVMAPYPFDETRVATGVTNLEYLFTQTVVWWRYVVNWLWPAWLVADHASFPVYRSLSEWPVFVALTGWCFVAVMVLRSWRTHPHRLFLLVSALALVSPTSSFLPLAEMLNEHRPYLPMGFAVMAVVLDAGLALRRVADRSMSAAVRWRTAAAVAAGGLVVLLAVLTRARTEVFRTQQAYLEDIVRKAPSGRSLMNLGLLHMQRGDLRGALALYEDALRYTPAWYTLHINLGIVHRALGNTETADRYLASAVALDRYSGVALVWRAEHHLVLKRYEAARDDFVAARAVNLERYRIAKGLATAWAGLGDAAHSLEETQRCLQLDGAQTLLDITAIVAPYFDGDARLSAGLAYFEALDRERPNTWWIVHNIGTLAGRRGDEERRASLHARSAKLRASERAG